MNSLPSITTSEVLAYVCSTRYMICTDLCCLDTNKTALIETNRSVIPLPLGCAIPQLYALIENSVYRKTTNMRNQPNINGPTNICCSSFRLLVTLNSVEMDSVDRGRTLSQCNKIVQCSEICLRQ